MCKFEDGKLFALLSVLNAFFFDTLEKTRYAVCKSASHMINFDCHTPFRISLTDEHRPSYLSRLYESEDHDDD